MRDTFVAVRTREFATVEQRDLVLFAAATLAAWTHTIDEMRIGELIAVPFGILNLAALVWWPRATAIRRALVTIAFGLFWALAVLPYHAVPLLQGTTTWQNVSGLSRLIGGAAMIGIGLAIARRATTQD